MKALLFALTAALLASMASAGQLYLQGGLAYQASHGPCREGSYIGQACLWDRSEPKRALGHLELGYEIIRGRVSAALYVRHESQPSVNDYGVNSAGVSMRLNIWSSR